MHKCLLCLRTDKLLEFSKNGQAQIFRKCLSCGFIFLDPEHHLQPEAEKIRYDLHQNNPLDQGYQNFLMPVVQAVLDQQLPLELGLDFGCGPASFIAHMLEPKGFKVACYDPYFHPDQKLLETQYDFITCTEVVEHFSHPRREFEKLHGLLKKKGKLYIKTSLTDAVTDFKNWHYQRDPTHVSFYNKSSLEYIKLKFGYSELKIFDKYLIFET